MRSGEKTVAGEPKGGAPGDRPYGLKQFVVWVLYLFVWPFGIPSMLAYRWLGSEEVFSFSAKALSLIPGKAGQYIRAAFYKMTLEESHCDLMVGFCSYFAHPTARVGRRVGTGSFTIVGTADISDNVLISSRVSVMSGKYQHLDPGSTDEAPRHPVYERVRIGQGSWLGEGCIVMASIGSQCIVSAGSVVTKAMPDRTTAIGNPARFLQMGGFANVNETRETA
jgi:virginiamycin A acetyltransferase